MRFWGIACVAAALLCAPWAFGAEEFPLTPEDMDIYDIVKDEVSLESFANISPLHRAMLGRLISETERAVNTTRALCFQGDMPKDVMAAFNRRMFGDQKFEELGPRWGTTATQGSGLAVGDPTVLTYSFIPDGTTIPEDPTLGNGDQPSDLQAFLDGIYGSTAAWQAEFEQVFDDWSAITGISYVFEPNDDGAAFPENGVSSGAPGLLGTRGDIRIGGYSIDGASGPNILAFNFFPESGDMVIDTDNVAFYSDLSSDSLNLRNVVAHEHGHGLGMFHVCPDNQTKLMEPIITSMFDGPQLDDLLLGQKNYSDPNVGNDSTGAAIDLGMIDDSSAGETQVSLFGNSEEDFYQFTTTTTQDISVILTPTGATYLSGEQNPPPDGSCTAGTSINTLTFMDIDVEILDTDGTTVLDTANSMPAGSPENATFASAPPGTYFVRVFSTDSADDVQAYDLDVAASASAGVGPVVVSPSGGGLYEIADGMIVLSFDVSNTTPPVTFQWSKNGTPLANGGNVSGADTSNLTLSPISEADSGAYVLTVTDASVKLVTESDPIHVTVGAQVPVAGFLALGGLIGGLGAAGALVIRRRRKQS